MFREATAKASFLRIEEQVQRFWWRTGVPDAVRHARLFARAQDRINAAPFVLCQQPLIPVGQPWADQVRLLATADLIARFRAMQGDVVHHQLGWSCHGLPVEVAVEQSLGPGGAAYDLARFNAACREAAIQGIQQGERLVERLGVWLDPAFSYSTLTSQVTSAIWGVLKHLWDEGRLRHERQVVPVCPRCATPLSTAEARRCATEVEGRSIWMRLPWSGEASTYLLTSTPNPWMLVGMVALVAHPDLSYALVECAEVDEPPIRLLLAESALERVLPAGYRLLRTMRGKSLRQTHYRPPFTFLPAGEGIDRVFLSSEVPTDQGTGLLPVVPAFDAFSLSLALAHQLPVPELLDDWGNLRTAMAGWQGLSPLEAEPFLVQDLRSRGLLLREESRTRQRALCPHCLTPLLPQARQVWWVAAEHGPWTVGRDRAWGIPMPVWMCEGCGEQLCLADLEELARRAGLSEEQIDPHRPMVDRLAFPCERCGGMMRRTAAVVDAAFEAAVAPLCIPTQPGPRAAPEAGTGCQSAVQKADLAVGLGDMHSGWLADLAETAGLARCLPAGEQAVVLPEIAGSPALRSTASLCLRTGQALAVRVSDGTGWEQIHSIPATALRWAAYTGTTPDEAEETFLRPLWQLITSDSATVASTSPSLRLCSGQALSEAAQQILARWLRARLYQVIGAVTDALERYQPEPAAAQLSALISDLPQWFAPHLEVGGSTAMETLGYLLAPFTPHLAEAIYQQVGRPAVESVHQAGWPAADPAWADPELLVHMAQVQKLSQLGRVARTQGAIVPEQLLRLAVVGRFGEQSMELNAVGAGGLANLLPYEELLQQQLCVERVELTEDTASQVGWQLMANPDRAMEQDLDHRQINMALAALGPDIAAELAAQLLNGSSVSLQVAEQLVRLLPDQISISARAAPGWAAAAGAGYLVLLAAGPSGHGVD